MISNPKISAIEITTGAANSPPPPTTTFTPVRVNAGGGAYTDVSGTSWSADTDFIGGATYAVGSAVANTNAPGSIRPRDMPLALFNTRLLCRTPLTT